MPLLLIYYILSVAEVNKLIVIALVFGFMGDVFLMLPKGKNNFILGLGSFLIGNVCYVFLFLEGISFAKRCTSMVLSYYNSIRYWSLHCSEKINRVFR